MVFENFIPRSVRPFFTVRLRVLEVKLAGGELIKVIFV